MQSRCGRFSLMLDEIQHILESYLNGQINGCVPVHINQCMNIRTFEFVNNAFPYYVKEIF